MQLRITSGIAKNKKVIAPDIPNFRAVQEVVKLAMFSIIGEKIESSHCLDLYAGSGNLGLEALSRGAAWCDFVDENRESKQAVSNNIKNMGFEEKAEFHLRDAVKYVGSTPNKYDIIFIDPFYEDTSHKFLMKQITNILHKNGVIFFLHGDNTKIDELIDQNDLRVIDERKYGKCRLTMLKENVRDNR